MSGNGTQSSMEIVVFFVGSSLLAPLREAERELNRRHLLGLRIACHNCTLPLSDREWSEAERDLAAADIVFVMHVTDHENSARIKAALEQFRSRHRAVIAINCLRDLMMRTRFGRRELFAIFRTEGEEPGTGLRLLRRVGSWVAGYAWARQRNGSVHRPDRYMRFLRRTPAALRLIPSTGPLGDIKHYLTLFCYFLQPTPANIRFMILAAIEHSVPLSGKRIKVEPPESMPVVGVYHPEAAAIFEDFDEYRKWYVRRRAAGLGPEQTVGLLLLRPQVVSGARRHYDGLIRAIEREGLSVIPVLSTFMDNRDACTQFLMDPLTHRARVSQLLSLTGFSFVGGPAMNDSKAAVAFLKSLNRPFRSAISLEVQRQEDWAQSMLGLNPVQTAMQVAIPEIDGATEPFVFGGLPAASDSPEPDEERCGRIARRLARWNRLRTLPRAQVRLALVIYCFPPNKGNLGTAAELDVFPSLHAILQRLRAEGYAVEVPASAGELREMLLSGDAFANVAGRLHADDYYRLCPYVDEIEAEWGPAPGNLHALGRQILIHGVTLGNVLVCVQPTFGYEGDPMRLMMAQGGTPHHGFMGLYTYLNQIFRADALVHVGTHGALEFMPGKQVGLSSRCWPDRLIGDFPNLYIYSVNNPSEGTIAKRRSYAELISYLTPPVENAGLYKELASLKELLSAYRQARDDRERERLFEVIEEAAAGLNLSATAPI